MCVLSSSHYDLGARCVSEMFAVLGGYALLIGS